MPKIGIGIDIGTPQYRGATIYEDVTSITSDLADGHDYNGAWDADGNVALGGIVLGHYGWAFHSAFSFDLDSAIPQGTSIISAVLEVVVVSSRAGTSLLIGCEDINIGELPVADTNEPNTWDMTSNTTPVATNPGAGVQQVDITTAVQEVINISNWDEERINVLVRDNPAAGHTGWGGYYWVVEDTDTGTTPAKLTIQYH